jgi:hypothetical protein
MQGAALIVLIVRAGIVLVLRGLGLVGWGHTRDLRDQEQTKQPWAESLKPTKHRPMPLRGACANVELLIAIQSRSIELELRVAEFASLLPSGNKTADSASCARSATASGAAAP